MTAGPYRPWQADGRDAFGAYPLAISIVLVIACLTGSLKGGSEFLKYPLLYKSLFVQLSAGVIFTARLLQHGFAAPRQRLTLRRSPFDLNLLLLFGWAALSVSWAEVPGHALVGLLQWVAVGMLMYVAFQSMRGERDIRLLLTAVFVAGVVVAAIGILQALAQFDLFAQVVSPASTFGNKNMAMHFIVLAFPAGLYVLLAAAYSLRGKSLAAAGLAALLAYALFSSTRAAWISLALEIVAFTALLFYFSRTGRRIGFGRSDWIAISFGVVVLVGLLAMHEGGLSGSARIAIEGVGKAASEAGDDTYIRYEIWKSTLDVALRHWVVGVGLNNYEYVFPALDPSRNLALLQHAHQDYLQLFMELGVVGVALFAWLLAKIVMVWRRLLPRVDGNDAVLLMTPVLAIGGIMVNALFCFPFQLPLPLLVAGLYLVILPLLQAKWEPESASGALLPPLAAVRSAGVAALVLLLLVGLIEHQWLQRVRELRQFAARGAVSLPDSQVWLRHPTYERILQALAEVLLDSGQYGKASALLDSELLVLRPGHSYERELQIQADLGSKGWASAARNIRDHLGLFPPGVQNLQRARLVSAYLRLGQTGPAVEALREAHVEMLRQQHSRAPRGTYGWLGKLATELREDSIARDFFERSAAEEPLKR
jgi:O-antigen ligase